MSIVAQILSFIPIIGRFFSTEKEDTPEPLPPAKIAIVGGGVGGCSAAYFLKKNGGDALDIHLFNEGEIGGRCAVIDFDGTKYEAGASIIHSSNKYLADFREEFGLNEYNSKKVATTPLSLYDGQRFFLKLGWYSIINNLKLLWRYGLSLIKMSRSVSRELKQFKNIYKLQSSGESYTTVPDMLRAMGDGDLFYEQTQVSGENYMTAGLGWQERLVDELVCAGMKVNYGQNCQQVNAMTAFVSLAGMDDGSLWSVINGNYQIPKMALAASGATVHPGKVSSVTRSGSTSGHVSYTLEYQPSDEDRSTTLSDFDVVIIAHPLNLSTVKFNGFPMTIYSTAAKTPYHRTVATFVKGELNGETFGLTDDTYPSSFPLDILCIDQDNPPVVFNSIGTLVPTSVSEEEANADYLKPLNKRPNRVWKVFSNHILSDDDKRKLFRKIDAVSVKDWMAYPEYGPPEEFPPFDLDGSGLLYINCIEKAASAMEMAAIGAKNVTLLAKKYILANKKNV